MRVGRLFARPYAWTERDISLAQFAGSYLNEVTPALRPISQEPPPADSSQYAPLGISSAEDAIRHTIWRSRSTQRLLPVVSRTSNGRSELIVEPTTNAPDERCSRHGKDRSQSADKAPQHRGSKVDKPESNAEQHALSHDSGGDSVTFATTKSRAVRRRVPLARVSRVSAGPDDAPSPCRSKQKYRKMVTSRPVITTVVKVLSETLPCQ
jgi:hypothetical protein